MFTLYDDDGECGWLPLEHHTDAEKERIEKELFELIGGYAYPIDWDFPISKAVAIYNKGIPEEYHLKVDPKEDVHIQLQLEDASDEINKLLLYFDVVIRVDDNNRYSSFTIENFAKKEIGTTYYEL